jgi:hypothetical protein
MGISSFRHSTQSMDDSGKKQRYGNMRRIKRHAEVDRVNAASLGPTRFLMRTALPSSTQPRMEPHLGIIPFSEQSVGHSENATHAIPSHNAAVPPSAQGGSGNGELGESHASGAFRTPDVWHYRLAIQQTSAGPPRASDHFYSSRRAVIGSRFEARRAGRNPASAAAKANTPAAREKVQGSFGLIP